MRKKKKVLAGVLFLIICIPSLSQAENKTPIGAQKTVSGVEALSPGLRELLVEEMVALEDGMMSIIPAYASANWSEIAETADRMEKSYILKKNLTDEQKKELHTSLPGAFIKLDQHFHYLAGMLNHAAKSQKPELVGFYFSELVESCATCHADYATHRFPAFVSEKQAEEHSH